MPTIAETLAIYAADQRHTPLSSDVTHHAKRALIDWFAALLPGSILTPATLLAEGLEDELDHGLRVCHHVQRNADRLVLKSHNAFVEPQTLQTLLGVDPQILRVATNIDGPVSRLQNILALENRNVEHLTWLFVVE